MGWLKLVWVHSDYSAAPLLESWWNQPTRVVDAFHSLHLELKLVSFPHTLLVQRSCVSCTSHGGTGAFLVPMSGLHFPESAAMINPAKVCFSAAAPGFGSAPSLTPELHKDLKYTKPKYPQQVWFHSDSRENRWKKRHFQKLGAGISCINKGTHWAQRVLSKFIINREGWATCTTLRCTRHRCNTLGRGVQSHRWEIWEVWQEVIRNERIRQNKTWTFNTTYLLRWSEMT